MIFGNKKNEFFKDGKLDAPKLAKATVGAVKNLAK